MKDIKEAINEFEDGNLEKELLYKLGTSSKYHISRRKSIDSPTLKNQWYVIAASSQLPLNGSKKLFVQLFCEPIILYRSSNGQVVAAQDHCPHRSAPLSMGKIENGVLQCIYHDWKFGDNGKAVSIPSAGKGFVDKIKLFTIPCYEQDEYIWIFHGDPQFANTNNILRFPMHLQQKEQCVQTIADFDGVWFII